MGAGCGAISQTLHGADIDHLHTGVTSCRKGIGLLVYVLVAYS